ncbi:argininosuccinate lyase [Roseomonas hellenica]|uniref:Argininosuccinate lyase n=1 Tax=Plastoroseomonas hellenica TaxID=2687306 RepID=A0ABS5ERF5_9PROT|nr:argininosuccinate lyase [Plastoroseomonas hellenica]MBR0662881.1 argininosuccinate lyase [Plastoroseomonas hellenica]
MSVASKVSRRLAEGIAPEVIEHIYGPRLAGELAATFPYLGALNAAHLVMLARQAILTPAQAGAIATGLLQIAEEGPDAITPDPALEDAYFNIEARLVTLIGADTGGRLHIARSRNDLSAAVDRLRMREILLDLLDTATALRRTLIARGAAFADVVMPGYTHLQPAQPITFGFYLTGLASALERDAARLLDAWPRLNLSPMGAAALATTTFPVDRTLTARLLGFDGVLEHALDCVASRDFSVEIVAAAAQMSLTLSRFAEDMHVAVSHEFSSVEFPDSVCGTSSIMPQKKNPVVLEHLKAKAAHVVAGFASAGACIRASHFTNTLDAHREGQAMIWPALAEARRALALAGIAAATVTPKADLLLARARANFSTATDLADALVRRAGLDFRTAHHVAGAVVRHLMDAGLQAHEATVAMVDAAAQEVAGRAAGLDAETVAEALDPVRSVAARKVTGGTAPAEVRRMAARMAESLARDEALTAGWRAGIAAAEVERGAAVRALAGR